jgi:PhoH-like ATPase
MSPTKRSVNAPRTVNTKSLKKGKQKSKIKVYVLDTNILVCDPHSIFKFQDNTVCLPIETLEELDNFKTEQTERGAAARSVHRILDKLFENDPKKMAEGVVTEHGGRVMVVINPLDDTSKSLKKMKAHFSDMKKMDHRILACALYVQETMPPPVILVSRDINMRLKAIAMGMEAQDYLNDKKDIVETGGHEEIEVTESELNRFYSDGEVTLEDTNLPLNTYVILVNKSDPSKKAAARVYANKVFKRTAVAEGVAIRGGIFLKPRSFEQRFLMDAILDPSISLITVQSKAGCGKTVVSLGTALNVLQTPNSTYHGVTISRPIVSMGKDLGALPGDINDKLRPWLQPYYDALQFLMPVRVTPIHPSQAGEPGSRKERKQQRHSGGESGGVGLKPYEGLIKSGLLEIEALQYIRGRSIPNRIFILDEAQNLTKHEIKTVITRMSEGSKIIIMGDPEQIDNPFVDSISNGLVYAANKLAGESCCAHIKLLKGERSKLAEIGSKLL